MIVREIKTSLMKVINNFDWFNDYDDTRQWAVVNCSSDVVDVLDRSYVMWLKIHNSPKPPTVPEPPSKG